MTETNSVRAHQSARGTEASPMADGFSSGMLTALCVPSSFS